MIATVEYAGLFSTVQHFGRYGELSGGVPAGGVMDDRSAAILNMLVGNEQRQPLVEMFQSGVRLQFTQTSLIALGGAQMEATLDGQICPVWRPFVVEKGSRLDCGRCSHGAWGYAAIAGGVRCPEREMTFGEPSALIAGDILVGGSNHSRLTNVIIRKLTRSKANSDRSYVSSENTPNWRLAHQLLPFSPDSPPGRVRSIRMIPGQHFMQLTRDFRRLLTEDALRVSTAVSRMGYRLETELTLSSEFPPLHHSQPVVPGAIQLPPDGQPIVLMPGCQTIGGYPLIGFVASVDLGKFAQVRSGQHIRFETIAVEEAQRLYAESAKEITQLKVGISCWATS